MPNSFYREIINDHNLRPSHKRPLADADLELRGVNPSCGDDITLRLKVSDGIITDGAYTGDGCAISQASADIMLDLIIGKDVGTAKRLYDIFSRMITGSITEEELDELEEAGALIDVSHMPARVKCAVLGWRTMNMLLDDVSPSNT
ncbi:MAG: SUF system NifU family Fe-S cluster assembly protein [Firmicutes bacterium]|nr:SUF system NifU family Fe-S cluster assembly protein [Bacillota bacterium]